MKEYVFIITHISRYSETIKPKTVHCHCDTVHAVDADSARNKFLKDNPDRKIVKIQNTRIEV